MYPTFQCLTRFCGPAATRPAATQNTEDPARLPFPRFLPVLFTFMRLSPGTRLGPYEIVSPLGAGGMGEVYRAKDTRLERDVAVKVLPEHLTENPEMRTRFEREARTISSLNHPHICTLFDVGREGDIEYLVMELVDGETLATRIGRGALPGPEALRLASQIADALDRAHRAGIVHRDFKPGNVMITRSGAKLMDFGLARAGAAAGATPGSSSHGLTIAHMSQSPTMASPLTQQGSLVGTYFYMAPEQLEGREVDARSDIWAFGCVLYEMLTGRRAFDGKSQASLVGAIMHTEPPPISASNATLSPAVEALVRACIAKDPEERIQTAHDIKLQLQWIAQSGAHSGATGPIELPKPKRRFQLLPWAIAALGVIAALFFALRGGTGGTPSAQQIAFSVPIPASLTPVGQPRISPDGTTLAFAATDSLNRTMIWLRPLNGLAMNPLPGTEGCRPPFWSPDSRSLGFVADGKLKKISVAGGPAQIICDAPSGSDGTWSKDGVILYDGANDDPIYRVNAAGGVPAIAVSGDSTTQVGWPAFLPDGKHYLFSRILIGGLSKTLVGELGSKKTRELPIDGSRVEYSLGHVLLARDRTLLAQRFDVGSQKLVGEPFPIAENLPVGVNGVANFAVSDNGILVYRATASAQNRLVWLSRTGQELSEVAPSADLRAPALSPDGSKIAIRRIEPGSSNLDIWVIDTMRGTTTRFTFDPGDDSNPIWSPDGSKIAWTGLRGNSNGIWTKAANGSGSDEKLADVGPNAAPTSWSRDASQVFYQFVAGGSLADISVVDVNGDHKPRAVLNSKFVETRAQISPDGKWLAYDSDESGRSEVYVISYPGGSGKWQISTNGGLEPNWSRDGRELYYLSADGRLMSVPIPAAGDFNPGTPQPLFRVATEPGRRRNVYCPSPDGKKFLFLVPAGQNQTPMTVLVNWLGNGRSK